MESLEQRYKNKIRDLEDQIKAMSGRSELSNAEWEARLRQKEEEFQLELKERNRKHNEQLKEKELLFEKKMTDIRKKAQEDLKNQEKTLTTQKEK